MGHGAWGKAGAFIALVVCGALSVNVAVGQGKKKAVKVATLEKTTFERVKLPKKQKVERFASQAGHNRTLTSISISADGKTMATASGLSDGLIKVWDVETGHVLHTLDSEDYVSLSPDGQWVAGGNVGGPIKVWNVATGELVKTLDGSGPVIFASGGAVLMGEAKAKKGVPEGTVTAWSTKDWSARPFAQPHESSLSAMAVSAKGDVVVTGSYDESIKIWDIKSGEVLGTLKEKIRTPSALAISPKLKLLAVSFQGQGSGVELWDMNTRKAVSLFESTGNVTSLAFSPDGQTLAGATTRGVTHLWGVDGSKRDEINGVGGQVLFTPDGSTLIHGSQAIAITDVGTREKLKEFAANDTEVFQTVFTPDNKSMLTTDARDSVEVWDLKTGDLRGLMAFDNGTREAPTGELILSPNGEFAILRPFVGDALTLWSLAGGVKGEPRTIKVDGLREIRGVTFAPNAKELVIESAGAGGEGTQIVWWNIAEGKKLNATKFSGYVSVNGFIDEGKTVALISTGTSSAKLSLKLWDRDTGLVKGFKVDDVPPFGGDIALATVGSLMALGDVDNTVKLWDRTTSKIVATLSGHTELVNIVAFSPDGRLLATGSWDESVKIWDVETGKELLSIDDMYQAHHISFSPHDDVVAISHHGWLKLIHLSTGRTRKLYYDERGTNVNWLIYDGSGHFQCVASGCDMVMYRTTDGELIGADDPRIKSLRGVEQFGR